MTIRSHLGAVLVVVLAANQSMPAQRAQPDAERWRAYAQRLESGARIEVRLRDGTKVRGTLVSVEETAMEVLPYTRVQMPVRALAFRDVDVIERWRKGWSPGAKTLVTIGVGVGASLLVAALVLAASLD
jgi:hypothetical protein